jgi:aminopeptidase-like protein
MKKIKNNINKIYGVKMMTWAEDLFDYNRSLTGRGVRKTLNYFKKFLPELKIYSVKSGSKAFDWKVPNEWEIHEAYIEDLHGNRIIDFKENNLHVLGYSTSINKILSFKDLNKKIYSDSKQVNAIPYRTSYYKKDWGFCLTDKQRKKLNKKSKYKVKIDSRHFKGKLNYGEIFIKGKVKKEILFSCNICHPSMANNELSGPILVAALAHFLKKKKHYYSYRFIFIPETIGAIVYIKKNLLRLKKELIAGFTLSCIGDKKNYSLLNSPNSNNYADKIAELNFKNNKIKFKKFSFLQRGSDERQFCSPNLDLPFCSILRTKHGYYREYHTSLDNLNFISKEGLSGSFKLIINLIKLIENDRIYYSNYIGEPFLTKYNLKRSLSGARYLDKETENIINLIAYSDGKRGLNEISKIMNVNINHLKKLAGKLVKKGLLKVKN